MTRLGKKLIAAAREGAALARGENPPINSVSSDIDEALQCLINDFSPPMTHDAVAEILEGYAKFLRAAPDPDRVTSPLPHSTPSRNRGT